MDSRRRLLFDASSATTKQGTAKANNIYGGRPSTAPQICGPVPGVHCVPIVYQRVVAFYLVQVIANCQALAPPGAHIGSGSG